VDTTDTTDTKDTTAADNLTDSHKLVAAVRSARQSPCSSLSLAPKYLALELSRIARQPNIAVSSAPLQLEHFKY